MAGGQGEIKQSPWKLEIASITEAAKTKEYALLLAVLIRNVYLHEKGVEDDPLWYSPPHEVRYIAGNDHCASKSEKY